MLHYLSTWARLIRMDYGFGGPTRATHLPLLGKRDTTYSTDSNLCDEEEA